MPLSRAHYPVPGPLRPHGAQHRIDPIGAGAILVAAIGLAATVLLLKPVAPRSDEPAGEAQIGSYV